MLVDNTRRPGPLGPDEPEKGTPLGVIGRWTGRVAVPGPSRLPENVPDTLAVSEPLRERAPFHAGLFEQGVYAPLDERGMESLGAWLNLSEAHAAEYADSILLSAMLEDVMRCNGTMRPVD